MKTYLVTVKLERQPGHDPRNKVTGRCRVLPNTTCTDSTGEHHTVMNTVNNGVTAEMVHKSWTERGLHVTRVEEVGVYVDAP